jgi:alginate O-acetyltransferase complex protein AlgI
MLLGGLWHGANWTFVIWGGRHGATLAVERKLTREKPRVAGPLHRLLKQIFIFHLVCVSWVFFRAQSLRAAWEMLKGLGRWTWRPEFPAAFLFLAVFSIPLLILDIYLETTGGEYFFAYAPVRWRVAFGFGVRGGDRPYGSESSKCIHLLPILRKSV